MIAWFVSLTLMDRIVIYPHLEIMAPGRFVFHNSVYFTLGHVIGYLHEHTRPDRDDYVTVKWRNIKEGDM